MKQWQRNVITWRVHLKLKSIEWYLRSSNALLCSIEFQEKYTLKPQWVWLFILLRDNFIIITFFTSKCTLSYKDAF